MAKLYLHIRPVACDEIEQIFEKVLLFTGAGSIITTEETVNGVCWSHSPLSVTRCVEG